MKAFVRVARPEDVEAIDELVKGCADEAALLLSPAGSAKYASFLLDELKVVPSSSWFVVAEGRGHVLAVAEFRYFADCLFLNHIYVRESARGSGLGRRLWAAGLEHAPEHCSVVALDVAYENTRAREWYLSMGLSEKSRTEWSQVEVSSEGEGSSWWVLLNGSQARLSLERYGFCHYSIATSKETYSVGFTGRAVRVSDLKVLGDRGVIEAACALAPGRALLYPGGPSLIPGARAAGIRLRMHGEIDAVRKTLGVENGD